MMKIFLSLGILLLVVGSLSAQNGELIIDNRGVASYSLSTPIPTDVSTFRSVLVTGNAGAYFPGVVTITDRLQVNSGADFSATRVILNNGSGMIPSGGNFRGILEGGDFVFTGPGSINIGGEIVASSLNISGLVLGHPAAYSTAQSKLKITLSGALVVSNTGDIDVSGRGFLGGYTTLSGNTLNHIWPQTIGNTSVILPKKGGTYGGLGGDPASATPVYGRIDLPFESGTGGSEPGLYTFGSGEVGGRGGAGGGRVWIIANSIQLEGDILANGGNGSNGYWQNGQGGSGGSVLIQTNSISGAGRIQANGGLSGTIAYHDSLFGGGGGGRIALHYTTRTGITIEAKGNIGDNWADPIPYNAGAGTIYLKNSALPYADLIVGNAIQTTSSVVTTPLPSIGSGTSTSIFPNQLSDLTRTFIPNSMIGLKLRPDATKSAVFTVVSNDDHNIFTDSVDGDMTLVASAGATYSGEQTFGNITLSGFSRSGTEDEIRLSGTLAINGSSDLSSSKLIFTGTTNTISTNSNGACRGEIHAQDLQITGGAVQIDGEIFANNLNLTGTTTLSHPLSSSTTEPGLKVTVSGNVVVPVGTKIDVSAKGYQGAYLAGTLQSPVQNGARTLGNQQIFLPKKGGSYGGLGGDHANANPVYGRIDRPFELGTGGSEPGSYAAGSGEFGAKGGHGGGRVWVIADTIQLDGPILANGGDGSSGYHLNGQGGSGGSILLEAETITGSGTITANGGKAGGTVYHTNDFGGGSGGRIALHYLSRSGLTLQAKGNLGDYSSQLQYNSGAGTVFLKNQLSAYGDLIIDNGGIDTGSAFYSTPIPSIGPGVSTALLSNQLTDTNRTFLTDRLIGIDLRPNSANTASYTVVDNDANSIFTDPADGDLTQFAVSGQSYIGQLTFLNVTVQGKARVRSFDDFIILGTKTVAAGSTLLANNNP